eukprot:6469817-Amphidinium_carterae.1
MSHTWSGGRSPRAPHPSSHSRACPTRNATQQSANPVARTHPPRPRARRQFGTLCALHRRPGGEDMMAKSYAVAAATALQEVRGTTLQKQRISDKLPCPGAPPYLIMALLPTRRPIVKR